MFDDEINLFLTMFKNSIKESLNFIKLLSQLVSQGMLETRQVTNPRLSCTLPHFISRLLKHK